MIAYKYCDRYGVNIIETLRLKITQPAEFNDPFEFTPRIVGDLSEAQAETMFADEKFVRFQYETMKSRGEAFPGDYEAFRRLLASETNRKALSKGFPIQQADAMRELARDNVKHVSQEFGVVCLSTVADSLLMWSHYADKHRGIVIGFDTDHPSFRSRNWYPVDYEEERVAVDVTSTLKEETLPALDIFKTKSRLWSYEKELRSIFRLSDNQWDRLPDGRDGYFWKIQNEMITDIKLGCRCPKATETSIRDALARNELSKVKLEQADIDESRFALLFRPA